MKALYCDICRKAIESPVKDRNYVHIREFDICDPCKEAIDARLRPTIREHFPYSADWYEQQVVGLLEKASASGRI